MNCKELAYMLADYFDGTMDPQLREELDAHLAQCEPCMNFTRTYQAVSHKTRELRQDLEYKIPEEVRNRLDNFVRDAALKFPDKVKEYREQVEMERREKVADLLKASVAGELSSITSLLVESHCAACPECGGFFDVLRNKRIPAGGDPPQTVQQHIVRILESLPPGEEFFLA